MSTYQILFDQHIQNMMARVTFMTCKINSAINRNRKVSIQLNDALIAALIPVVSAPRFAFHIFNSEVFFQWHLNVLHSSAATLLNRSSKHCIELLFRNDEVFLEFGISS